MAHSDSEEDVLDDILDDTEFDGSDGDEDIDEDILEALEGDLAAAAAAEATEEEDYTDESEGISEDEDVGEEQPSPRKALTELNTEPLSTARSPSKPPSPQHISPVVQALSPAPGSPVPQTRPLSPAQVRKVQLLSNISWPRSFIVEAICAMPHPAPTHCLASSLCMTHLLTGSDDGYIRDYDTFSAVNGKIFLTAPQRHHCGVMEGLMKAGQIRCWWENPVPIAGMNIRAEDAPLCPVYSLAMQSDALWALSGSNQGHINLFTVRHNPGRLCHVMTGHRRPVSALAMQHDEKGFFSAGWDGEARQWDLNTGQTVRSFISHGAQLVAIAVRPLESDFHGHRWRTPPPQPQAVVQYQYAVTAGKSRTKTSVPPRQQDQDSRSDSFDPLFDDEPDADGEPDNDDEAQAPARALNSTSQPQNAGNLDAYTPLHYPGAQAEVKPMPRSVSGAIAPKNAPPVLDSTSYAAFSPDTLMTASIDGQIILWDTRVHSPGYGVGRLWMSDKTPPWCVSACWSADGAHIYVGRRNGTVEIYDVRQSGRGAMGTPKILKTLRNPISSGVVSCVVAFPDGRHLACASNDNIRLWNVAEAGEPDSWGRMKSGVQFKIIPGHHGGYISQMLVDPAARFLVTASSNRGWHGESTKTVFVHEIRHMK